MQNVLYWMAALLIFMTCVSVLLAARLGRYRRQTRHMIEELSMLRQEDTNYRLSSCCHAGRTQEIITLFNEIVENYRREMIILKRENRTYRQSITSISHDIRTPLTSAKGYLQMLSKDTLSDDDMKKHQEYIATVERRVDDVTDLLNQLFEYARVEAGELEFVMERINLANLFLDTVSMFYNDFLNIDYEPVIDVPSAPCYVLADRNALVRIIENLIKNALVHGTGEYHFSLRTHDGQVCLRVSNRTDHIEQKDLDRIFDRFYTTDTSRTHKTTGLGLAIVKQFAERMNGEVSASLQGDIFMVDIVFQLG
ncbi:MAG: HAMP domain-containing histidine kinase [Lachnospiraceae bacterium]|nr:HAMP domain-containing histidine kinase [Lachnospiraceae bacterium]